MPTTITISKETKAALAVEKGEDETWDEYLQTLAGTDREPVPCQPVAPVDLSDAERERLLAGVSELLESYTSGR